MNNNPDKLNDPPYLAFPVRAENGLIEGHSSDEITTFIFVVYIKAHAAVGFWGVTQPHKYLVTSPPR